jgi:hypothetical protein
LPRYAALLPTLLSALAVALPAGVASGQPLELPGAQFNLPPLSVPELPPPQAPDAPAAPTAPQAPQPLDPSAAPLVGPAPAPQADITALTLRRDAREGELRLSRDADGGLAATLTLEGRGMTDAQEICQVTIADEAAGVALEPVPSLGRYARYRLAAPACPVVLTLFSDAALVAHEGFCTFEAADCRADPNGLWGPEPEALPTDPERIARDLAEADEDVRAAYRMMAERSQGDALRGVLAEQAGFSAERVTTCARFAGEDAHGLCAARFTQARAASLQQRLGFLPPPVDAGAPTDAGPGAAPLSILPQDN